MIFNRTVFSKLGIDILEMYIIYWKWKISTGKFGKFVSQKMYVHVNKL